MNRKLTGALLLILLPVWVQAQISIPDQSPHTTISQQLGLTEIVLDYSRPGVKGRTIFGEVVPYGEIWRTGANSSTKIEFKDDITVNGHPFAAGKYALYSIPGKDKWTIIFNINTKLWGAGGYDQQHDFIRFDIIPHSVAHLTETFTIDIQNISSNTADLVIQWEYTQLRIPLEMDTDSKVFSQIREQLLATSTDQKASTYYNAALYYHEKGLNSKQALEWMQKAVSKNPSAFWYLYFYAEMLHKDGQDEKALDYIDQAIKLAKESEKGDFGYLAKLTILERVIKEK